MATGFIYVEKLAERERDAIIQSGSFPTYRTLVTLDRGEGREVTTCMRITAVEDEAMHAAKEWARAHDVRAVRIVEAAA